MHFSAFDCFIALPDALRERVKSTIYMYICIFLSNDRIWYTARMHVHVLIWMGYVIKEFVELFKKGVPVFYWNKTFLFVQQM